MINSLWKLITGHCWSHKRCAEDVGGCIIECCENCPWTGRHMEYPIKYINN